MSQIGGWYHALKKENVLHFIPALLLLLVNSHLGNPGELAGFLPAQRMILALSQRQDSPTVRCRTATFAVQALAWVNRWQSFAPEEEARPSGPMVVYDDPVARAAEEYCPSDRSRDGPA